MGAAILLLTLAMTTPAEAEKPRCERAVRAAVWPDNWRGVKDCETVEICTCGPFRCGWKAVSVPIWVLAGAPRPAACGGAGRGGPDASPESATIAP